MFRLRRPKSTAVEAYDHGDDRVVTVTDGNFLDSTVGQYTVVDFWAPWCGPCRAFSPVFHEVAAHAANDVRFGACNVDDHPSTAALLQISTIPTVVVFDPDGSEAGRSSGVLGRQRLEQLIAEARTRVPNPRAGGR